MFCRFVYMEEVVYIRVFVSVFVVVFCCLKYMFFSIFKQAYSYAISLTFTGIVDENFFFQDFSVRVGMVY